MTRSWRLCCCPGRGGACLRRRAGGDATASIDAAQALFYNGQYAEAAELSQTLRQTDGRLAVYELRTSPSCSSCAGPSASRADKEKAFKACARVQELLQRVHADEFRAGTVGREEVLRRASERPAGTVLSRQARPELRLAGARHARAQDRVERVLGGAPLARRGARAPSRTICAPASRARGSTTSSTRDAVGHRVDARRRQQEEGAGGDAGGGRRTPSDFYASAEALFGLWDMQVREKNYKAALEPALRLAEMFPKNPRGGALHRDPRGDAAASQINW